MSSGGFTLPNEIGQQLERDREAGVVAWSATYEITVNCDGEPRMALIKESKYFAGSRIFDEKAKEVQSVSKDQGRAQSPGAAQTEKTQLRNELGSMAEDQG